MIRLATFNLNMINAIKFDNNQFDFVKIFQKYFDEDISRLHKKYTFERAFSNQAGGTEEFELVSNTYSDVIKTPIFKKLWINFINEVVKPFFDNRSIYIQKLPSFRIFPSLHSVQYVQKITDGYNKHLDGEPPYYHPIFETNFWIPLTECDHLNDFYYQDEKTEDWYRRADIRMNEMLVFSSNVIHGNRVHNESPNTRCSLDFKALAVDDYIEDMLTDQQVLKRGKKFKHRDWYSTEHYYMEM